jgi:hypothetical protein
MTTNRFEQILINAAEERQRRRNANQQYAAYWQSQSDLPQKPKETFTPEDSRPIPHSQKEWIRRRVQEILMGDHKD